MPVLRYFVVAGAGLLALLFVANAWLPAPAVTHRDANALDKTTIRINGDKPVVDRVTIDTSLPTIVPPPASAVAQGELKNEQAADSRRDALARMDDPAATAPEMTTAPVKKIARRHIKKPARAVAMARPAGFFDFW